MSTAKTPLSQELRALAVLALPLSVAQLALMGMHLVDTAIVGRSSVADLAGVSLGRSISFAVFSVPMGVALALEPLASQAVGAKEHDRAWAAFVATMKASLALWPATFAVSYAATFLLPLVGIEADIAVRARAFLVGNGLSPVLFALFLATKTLLQAQSHTMPTLVAAAVGNIVNWGTCTLLVREAKLGAFGAGLSSTIGTAVLLAVVLFAVRSLRTEVPPDRHVSVRRVLSIGIPIGLQLLAEIGVFSVAAVFVAKFGPSVVAAHQIALGLASFTFMMTIGVSSATAVRVGHAIGQERPARRSGLLGIALGGTLQAVGAIVFFAIPEKLVAIFTSDPDVLALGVLLVRIAAVFQLFDGVQGVAGGALRGAGDVRFAFLANVVSHWLVGFPIALVLGFALEWGARGIWYGLTAGLVVVAVVATIRFSRISKEVIARV
jgi:MATE family multidrug resistance protein